MKNYVLVKPRNPRSIEFNTLNLLFHYCEHLGDKKSHPTANGLEWQHIRRNLRAITRKPHTAVEKILRLNFVRALIVTLNCDFIRNNVKINLAEIQMVQWLRTLRPKQLQSDQELLQQLDAGLTEDELALKNTIERIIAAPNTITPGRSACGEHDGEIKKMTLNEPCSSHQKDELRPPQIRPANPEATDGYGEHEEEIERMFNASQSSNSSETHPFADSGSEYIPTSDSESTPSIIENEDPNIREYGDPDEGRKRTRVADPTN